MDDRDSEPPFPSDGEEEETETGDDLVEPTDEESHFAEPLDDYEPRAEGPSGPDDDHGNGGERSDQDKWRRFGWAALIILTIGVGWALILSTILINRSGDRTAELISLFEQGQQQRGAIPAEASQNQQTRRATLAAQREQAELYRTQQATERASAFQSNTQARQNIANTALADAQTRQANNLAALASIQAQTAQRQLDLPQPSLLLPTDALSPPLPTGQGLSELLQTNAQLQQALLEAIDDLTKAIKKLREELCPRPPCGPR